MKFDTSLTAKNLGSSTNRVVLGIVLHDTAGNGGHGDTKYLATDPEKRGVSVDFCVERNGTVFKLNPDLKRYYTYHAGRSSKFKGYTNGSVNRVTVGIEMNQKSEMADWAKQGEVEWPSAQVKACAELCAWICKQFGLSKNDITTHKSIITDGSRSDPRGFPFTKFWEYFNAATLGLSGGNVEEAVPNSKPTYHTVKSGDTLWGIARQYNTTIEAIKKLNHSKYPSLQSPSTMINVGWSLMVKE